jgi:hypothetical protein
LQPLWQGHLVRLRDARRRRDGERRAVAALHLPLIHRRSVGAQRAVADPSSVLTGREAFLVKLQAREQMARERLSAATGHLSLCRVPTGLAGTVDTVGTVGAAGTGDLGGTDRQVRPGETGTQRRSAKYYEGAAVALADVRRAVRSTGDDGVVAAIDAVRASWDGQADLPGRTAPSWFDYLEGGRDALIRLEEEDMT